MRVIVNASTVKIGGGLSVTINILQAFSKMSFDYTLFILVPSNCGYEQITDNKIQIIYVPRLLLFWIFRYFLDFVWLKRQINRIKPDIILSMGNLPTPVYIPQILSFDNAFSTIKDFSGFNLSHKSILIHKMRNWSFSRRLKYVDTIIVQTELIKERLFNLYPRIKNVKVIPTSYTASILHVEEEFTGKKKFTNDHSFLCFTRYYEHKNLDVLVSLAEIIKSEGANYRIYITLENGSDARKYLKTIKKRNLDDIIINLGSIERDEIPSIYYKVDSLLMPTLLESLSSTYLDAMYYGKTIFTSDRDFARLVCGEAAYYFDPLSPSTIYQILLQSIENGDERESKACIGRKRVNEFPTWSEVAHMYIVEMENLLKYS